MTIKLSNNVKLKKIAMSIKSFFQLVWGASKVYIPMIIFIWAIGTFGYAGFWTITGIYLLVAAVIIVVHRKAWLSAKHLIETVFFGKPLKECTPEELRHKKFKFVLKKKRRLDHEETKSNEEHAGEDGVKRIADQKNDGVTKSKDKQKYSMRKMLRKNVSKRKSKTVRPQSIKRKNVS